MLDLVRQNSTAREDLGMLAVMDALAEEERITQRELSRKTGLNLKKVNYCLHKLLEKGHVKFQRVLHNPDKRAYLYILTPSGVKAKSVLTYRFLKFTLAFYSQVERRLTQCLTRMEAAGVRRLVLFGVSEVVRVVLKQVDGNSISVAGILVAGMRDEKDEGDYEVPVLRPDDLERIQWDGILITAVDDVEGLDRRLEELGFPEEKVWRLS